MASSGLVRLGLAKALLSAASAASPTSPTGVVAVFDRPTSPQPASGYIAASGTPKAGRKQSWLPAALRTPTKQDAAVVFKTSHGSPAPLSARPVSASASATKNSFLAAHRGFPALAIQTTDESAGTRFTQPKPASTPIASSPKVRHALILMIHTLLIYNAPPHDPQVSSFLVSSPRQDGHIPGYSGHVPGYSHVAGRSFTKATKRAMSRDAIAHMLGESIPSSPHANPKVPVADTTPGHIPGYAGHVPNLQHTLGGTFGKCTSECPSGDLGKFNGLRAKASRKSMVSTALHFTPVPSSR